MNIPRNSDVPTLVQVAEHGSRMASQPHSNGEVVQGQKYLVRSDTVTYSVYIYTKINPH